MVVMIKYATKFQGQKVALFDSEDLTDEEARGLVQTEQPNDKIIYITQAQYRNVFKSLMEGNAKYEVWKCTEMGKDYYVKAFDGDGDRLKASNDAHNYAYKMDQLKDGWHYYVKDVGSIHD